MAIEYSRVSYDEDTNTVTWDMFLPDFQDGEGCNRITTTWRSGGNCIRSQAVYSLNGVEVRRDPVVTTPCEHSDPVSSLRLMFRAMCTSIKAPPTEDELSSAGAEYVAGWDEGYCLHYKGLYFEIDVTGRSDRAYMPRAGSRQYIGYVGDGQSEVYIFPEPYTLFVKEEHEPVRERVPADEVGDFPF